MKKSTRPYRRILNAACILALVGLGMMVWSMVDPRPLPVVFAMSVGQAIGTLSFAAFLYVVIRDLRAQMRGPSPVELEPVFSTPPPKAE